MQHALNRSARTIEKEQPVTNLPGMKTEEAQPSASAEQLCERMTSELRELKAIRSPEMEAAFRKVPRHRFAPEAPLDKVYAAEDAVVTKRDEHGIATSSVSAARIQAFMLEQAEIRPGMRVLEIGSGGYNAALMAELVGPSGKVTTLDIDPFVTGRARQFLADAGYERVNVVLADGEHGAKDYAPKGGFDAIIVTVGAWDIAPEWVEQLAPGGRLVVPLRMHGFTRSIAFEREGDHLASRSVEVCGFVPMQGEGAHKERLLLLRGKEVGLRFDDGEPADLELLNGALDAPPAEVWTGVTIRDMEPFDTLQLWLATAMEGFCLLSVDPDLDTGIVSPANRQAAPTVVERRSLAYLTHRKVGVDEDTGQSTFEFGVHGRGPESEGLAKTMAKQVRVWNRDHRSGKGPKIAAYPRSTPDEQLPDGPIINKRHVRLTFSWT